MNMEKTSARKLEKVKPPENNMSILPSCAVYYQPDKKKKCHHAQFHKIEKDRSDDRNNQKSVGSRPGAARQRLLIGDCSCRAPHQKAERGSRHDRALVIA